MKRAFIEIGIFDTFTQQTIKNLTAVVVWRTIRMHEISALPTKPWQRFSHKNAFLSKCPQ